MDCVAQLLTPKTVSVIKTVVTAGTAEKGRSSLLSPEEVFIDVY